MTRSIWAIRIVVFVAFLDLFIQFPVVAPLARRLGATDTLVGLVVGTYSLTNLVGNLAAGLLLDRLPRRPLVLLGLVASALALIAYALVTTTEQLLVVRAVHGLTTAVLTPGAFALLGDAAVADRRARVMGVSGAIIAVAAVLGPPLAGITRDRLGPGQVFVGGGLAMLLAALIFALAAQDGRRPPRASVSRDRVSLPWSTYVQPRLLVAYLGALALTVGLGTLVTHLPLALDARGQLSTLTGTAFTVYALVAMVVMAGPLNRLSDQGDRVGPLAAGLGLVGLGLVILGVTDGLLGLLGGMAVFGLGFGLLFPAATALVAEIGGPAARGTTFGIFYAVYSAGVVVGSLLSGVLDDQLGRLTAAPFLVSGILALIVVPLLLALGRRRSISVEPSPS